MPTPPPRLPGTMPRPPPSPLLHLLPLLLFALAAPALAQGGNSTAAGFAAAWPGDAAACVAACNGSLYVQCGGQDVVGYCYQQCTECGRRCAAFGEEQASWARRGAGVTAGDVRCNFTCGAVVAVGGVPPDPCGCPESGPARGRWLTFCRSSMVSPYRPSGSLHPPVQTEDRAT
ncbi:hypothetical protein DFJ74DRAFT_682858 [Hyaloraphidium curvatum]|nr:hypothetical protein DFJ74DRAFT_682858 [Hyaloraphidium curvatum]